MDAPRSCSNNCVFCFIDQLPRGMRKTMYFKDDDARLSFLHGELHDADKSFGAGDTAHHRPAA
jgi:NifB/MoaA-like Fe-S oxidoreductase